MLREAGGVTWLEWLRTPAADGSARPIVGQIEKLRELQALEADLVELSMLPQATEVYVTLAAADVTVLPRGHRPSCRSVGVVGR